MREVEVGRTLGKRLEVTRGINKGEPVAVKGAFILKSELKLMKELGFGREYRYAHDEPEAYAAGEDYFPEGMPDVRFYEPVPRGLEARIAEKLAHLRELDEQARKRKR